MTKQELIQAHWNWLGFVSMPTDENGWVNCDILPDAFDKSTLDIEKRINSKRWTIIFVRPKSLNGIENNNGWIKIVDKDNLPKRIAEYHVFFNSDTLSEYIGKAKYHGDNLWTTAFDIFPKSTKEHHISHYQEIIIPQELPLF
jgi:hypothetical protein